MNSSFVADGAERYLSSVKVAAKLAALRQEIEQRYNDDLLFAGIIRTCVLKWRMHREYVREARRLVPSIYSLYQRLTAVGVSGQTGVHRVGQEFMNLHGFVDVREFRVRLTEPLYPYGSRGCLGARWAKDVPHGESGWFGIHELVDSNFFKSNFADKNPLNIPGPIYGAETDTCCTGPGEAPHNVLLDKGGQEFVFQQARDPSELDQLVNAAMHECFVGYGADGDAHWRLSLIREWWQTRDDMLLADIYSDYCEPESITRWRRFLEGEAKGYLRVYAFFVEHGRVPRQGDQLPDIE